MSALETAVRAIVDLLVRGQYETITKVTRARRLTAAELAAAVRDYGRQLDPPGEGWWETVEITPVLASEPPKFHVAAPLWSREEGRSDLTLELELTQTPTHTYETEILGIHVL